MKITKKQMIEMVKRTGEFIVNNAESIVGDNYDFLVSLDLSISFDKDIDTVPKLDVHRSIQPKEIFDYITSDKWFIDKDEN